VLIEGHTDSVGKDDYNLALSRKRADSVKAKLVEDGIEAGGSPPSGMKDVPRGQQRHQCRQGPEPSSGCRHPERRVKAESQIRQ